VKFIGEGEQLLYIFFTKLLEKIWARFLPISTGEAFIQTRHTNSQSQTHCYWK